MGSFGLGHWLVVLVIVLLLFGAGRLSDIGKGLGEGIKNFKKGLNDDDEAAPPGRGVIKTHELETTPAPKQLADAPKKKRVIQVEVDDDDDDEAVARKIAESKKASKTDA
jgi:sec-independent protein translocase protein TatA